jgi:hypothetical protein
MQQDTTEKIIELARLLVLRMERLSADSTWAHQASGYRGALIKGIERVQGGETTDIQQLNWLIEQGFLLIQEAARELTDLHPVLEELRSLMDNSKP